MQWCNWRCTVINTKYRRPALPTQGTGWDVFMGVSPKGPDAFSRHALDLPFTDKGIQACRLKGSTAASGQSEVCRHSRAMNMLLLLSLSDLMMGTVVIFLTLDTSVFSIRLVLL